MHDSINCPCVDKSNCVIKQINAAKESAPSNNPYSNTYNHGCQNHTNFSWRSQNVENPQVYSSRPTPPGFQNQRYVPPSSHQAPFGSSDID